MGQFITPDEKSSVILDNEQASAYITSHLCSLSGSVTTATGCELNPLYFSQPCRTIL